MVTCQSRATQDTLRGKGRTVREIVIDELSEENLGGLFVSFMLETVITAHLMGVDAFDQPAVEEGKILTRQYLGELEG
jgi:glucose-6-phosphate isomerase